MVRPRRYSDEWLAKRPGFTRREPLTEDQYREEMRARGVRGGRAKVASGIRYGERADALLRKF